MGEGGLATLFETAFKDASLKWIPLQSKLKAGTLLQKQNKTKTVKALHYSSRIHSVLLSSRDLIVSGNISKNGRDGFNFSQVHFVKHNLRKTLPSKVACCPC